MRIKINLREKKSLIRLFAFLCFLLACVFMLLVRAKSFPKKIKSLNGPKKLLFVSSRQFSFLNGPHKGINVFTYISTFIPL